MFRRTIQTTFKSFNIQNYTRRFYNQTIQTFHSTPRTYTHTLAVATVSALSISAYSYQNTESDAKAASHTTNLSVIPSKSITLSNTNKFQKPLINWSEREIIDQPIAISKALKHGTVFHFQNGEQNIHLQPLLNNKATLSQISDLIITNNGSENKNAALYAQKLMQYIESFNTVKIADYISENAQKTGNILCVNNDNISLNNKIKLELNNSESSFTSNVTVLSLIAAWFSQLNGKKSSHNNQKLMTALHKLVTYFGGVIKINKDKCIQIGENINDNILILGKGFGECIAYEGCDKIKQITNMNITVNKNVLSDSDENISVICIILDDENKSEMVEKAKNYSKSGADMIYITDNIELLNGLDNINNDKVIKIPNNGPLTALLAVVPLQLIGHYIAMTKGLVTIDEDIDE